MFAGRPSVDPTPRGALLIRLCNWVGEAVLSLPALGRLAESGYELRLYGKGWAPALFEGAGWPVTVRQGGVRNAAAELRGLRRRLEVGGAAPPALLMTNSFSSALETRLAGFAPSGYAREGRGLLLRNAYPLPKFAHAAETYWHLAGCFLGARFLDVEETFPAALGWAPSAAQRERARALLARHGLTPGFFIVFCPFSGPDDPGHRKVWPGFSELARRLGEPVVVCPGPGEEAAAAALGNNVLSLPGIDLGVYGALFELARGVVANDTGPGHLAAAAGARLISIYGPQSVAAWEPIGPRVRLFHDPAGWPAVENVAAAVLATE